MAKDTMFGVKLRSEVQELREEVKELFGSKIREEWLEGEPYTFQDVATLTRSGEPVVRLNRASALNETEIAHWTSRQPLRSGV